MKRILILAVMASVSTSAFATTSTDPVVNFEGERAQVCEVREFESSIDFGLLTNLGDGASTTDEVELFCNVRYTATVESDNGYLKLDTTVGDAQPTSQGDLTAQGYSGFAAAVNYQITTILGTASTALISNDTPVALGGVQDPINLTTSVTYDTVAGTKPLLGGTYEDTVTLSITPIIF